MKRKWFSLILAGTLLLLPGCKAVQTTSATAAVEPPTKAAVQSTTTPATTAAEISVDDLPVPKFDAEQDRYFDVVYYPYQTAHLWTVPAMCENKDYASFVLNVMAVHSARIDNTMDAYYTKTLELSVAQDAGSRATLKIVRDNVTYDICLLYDWGDFLSGTLSPLHSAASNRYSEATTANQIDFAIEEMEATLLGFREPQLPDFEG